ncbi:amidohydrolase [Clostridium saccharoperbutylacetonicum]|uniref:amidohydrolase n=1 Tax=Clostridium saccharoperbutylacetonicum TaxID=36745 RepID=UPI0009839A72|nr:amidohydrolase [Clostridium saccharoperbutylacetonicum]AQR97550.1 imidazolonepropionase [Clostridium saccharoperbutylacetonicum]
MIFVKITILKNGVLYDLEQDKYNMKDVAIKDGKIIELGEKLENNYEEAEIINLNEKLVLPGCIDCHTHLGIIEECTGKIGIDNNETSNPVTPHLNGIDGINPFDIAFKDAVRAGVTCVMSGPGSNNVVGGRNVVLKTCGTIIDKMTIKNPAGFKISLGENPLSTYGINDKCPVTRMGAAALIRELFMRTEDYIIRKENNKLKERDIRLEAVIPVLKGQIPLRVHAHRADDIVTAIRIAEEFNICKMVIEHGTEAHLVKSYLKEKKVPVAYGPLLTPRIKMELKSRNYSSIVELVEAGVKTALITDHPYNSIDCLRTVAAITLARGLSFKDAIKAITINAAEILNCEDRIGKIEVGYDADLAIYDGDPLDIKSKVTNTIINGKVVYTANEY